MRPLCKPRESGLLREKETDAGRECPDTSRGGQGVLLPASRCVESRPGNNSQGRMGVLEETTQNCWKRTRAEGDAEQAGAEGEGEPGARPRFQGDRAVRVLRLGRPGQGPCLQGPRRSRCAHADHPERRLRLEALIQPHRQGPLTALYYTQSHVVTGPGDEDAGTFGAVGFCPHSGCR